MKISNETKIGILAAVGITLLVLGFTFLKGKNLFEKQKHLYAVYEDIQGLAPSNPVVVNGMQIGTVLTTNGGKDMRRILVTINLTKDVLIPTNSLAIINPSLLGSISLEIKLGDANTYLKNNDTLLTKLSGGAFDEAMKLLNPVLYEVRNAVKSLDSVLHIVGSVFDATSKNNIKEILANLNTTTASFSHSAVAMQTFLDPKNGAMAQSMANANLFTKNLVENNQKLTSIMANSEKATAKFADLDFQKSLNKLDDAINDMRTGIAKINSKEGSLGLLLNDKQLYTNLTTTSNKLNILLDDVRAHPKRYVNISVFGKKEKGNYLTAPLVDDSVTIIKK